MRSGQEPAVVELALPFEPTSVSAGREATDRFLSAQLTEERLQDVELLVSELLTNAIRHGEPRTDGTIVLRLEVLEDRVRVAVEDGGRYFNWQQVVLDGQRSSGRGLAFVDTLATTWGLSRDGSKGVWFEVPL